MRTSIPLRRRPVDLVFLAFFVINATFITYIVDIEQLVIVDPSTFDYPLWPPPSLVDLVHWYGENYDPLLIARPPFWRMTIWIDVIFFGPFYFFALYAFIRGRDWIRVPALVWSGTMAANVLIILMEERYGPFATDHFGLVLALNGPWLLMPFAMIARMRTNHPFTEPDAMPDRAAEPAAMPDRAAEPAARPKKPCFPRTRAVPRTVIGSVTGLSRCPARSPEHRFTFSRCPEFSSTRN